ncbi:hypothetical protein AB833_03305 [Chromatiales bacterium (ex Bugula neritina AB1)]|nr:hypothetical protein AB833_03305 [Chromatiales bacterium (ex Bugula neritina AB1)]
MASIETKSQDQSDSALMLSFAAGDSNGFDLLYRRHKDSVYKFLYFGSAGDKLLASELFQDVWMTVVRGRTRYNVEIQFTDWLHHISWARLYDHLRLHPCVAEDIPVSASLGLSDSTSTGNVVWLKTPGGTESDSSLDEEDSLLGQVQQLNDDQREIVLLRYCFRMDFKEISEFLDVGLSTVNRLHREAVASLRSTLPEAC